MTWSSILNFFWRLFFCMKTDLKNDFSFFQAPNRIMFFSLLASAQLCFLHFSTLALAFDGGLSVSHTRLKLLSKNASNHSGSIISASHLNHLLIGFLIVSLCLLCCVIAAACLFCRTPSPSLLKSTLSIESSHCNALKSTERQTIPFTVKSKSQSSRGVLPKALVEAKSKSKSRTTASAAAAAAALPVADDVLLLSLSPKSASGGGGKSGGSKRSTLRPLKQALEKKSGKS